MRALRLPFSSSARAVYGQSVSQALGLHGVDGDQATQNYFVKTLAASHPKTYLRRGLKVSQCFFNKAPQSSMAATTRRVLVSALTQLCPAYQRAHVAHADLHTLGCFIGGIAGFLTLFQAGASCEPGGVLQAESQGMQDALADVWPRMCVQERSLMRWALGGDEDILDAIRQILDKPGRLPHSMQAASVQGRKIVQSALHLSQVAPLTAQQTAQLAKLQALRQARRNPSLRRQFSTPITTNAVRGDTQQMWTQCCRIHIDASRSLDITALLAALTTPSGRRYVRAEHSARKQGEHEATIRMAHAWRERSSDVLQRRFAALRSQSPKAHAAL